MAIGVGGEGDVREVGVGGEETGADGLGGVFEGEDDGRGWNRKLRIENRKREGEGAGEAGGEVEGEEGFTGAGFAEEEEQRSCGETR